ncbi:hypothetical protein [Mycobacterium persicum]|uniref:hypothetical protein n=1 Tax=Mycobacterium persicum TaxID=1487726 RepID=UPI000AEE3BB3|nr:hypothetical protein [Mycobacterium persicum]
MMTRSGAARILVYVKELHWPAMERRFAGHCGTLPPRVCPRVVPGMSARAEIPPVLTGRSSNETAQRGERHRGYAAQSQLRDPYRQIVTPGPSPETQ